MAAEGQDQAAYTPGPWYVSNGSVYSDHVGDLVIRVAYMARDTERTRPVERDANARLIAAAPDLLATLRDLVGALPPCSEETYSGTRCADVGEPLCLRCQGEAAIAKAEGRAE